MNLTVVRQWFYPHASLGLLKINDTYTCFTLEDAARAEGVKICGSTAIPPGKYAVVIDHSERFGKEMPHVLNVPMFEGIRIHAGNTDQDTSGCILVGLSRAGDKIFDSRKAYDMVFEKIRQALDQKEEVWLEVVNRQV